MYQQVVEAKVGSDQWLVKGEVGPDATVVEGVVGSDVKERRIKGVDLVVEWTMGSSFRMRARDDVAESALALIKKGMRVRVQGGGTKLRYDQEGKWPRRTLVSVISFEVLGS